ncbi:MAG: hypothetical protein M3498_09560 [Deinococcota bacterium]|nr:hypothetical protein [Deinococcota bacterium]
MTKPRLSRLATVLRRLGLLFALLLGGQVAASPSVFLENALFSSLGYLAGPSARLGAEVVVPVPVIDASLGLEALVAPGVWGTRLSLSALVLPAVGTTPPLAVGAGADVGYGSAGLSAHLGGIVGTDLLFSLDLPMTASLYLAPGYAAGGPSLAWSAQLRYYLDDPVLGGPVGGLALELESSDLQLLSLGVRVLF